MNMNLRIPYGLNPATKRLTKVDDVPTGIACGLICPYCNEDLVAKNAGKVRAHHFSHHRESTSCEGWLHATAKFALYQRQQDALDEGTSIPMEWVCGNCGCTHEGNLLKRLHSVQLEKFIQGKESRVKPDITGFGPDGSVTVFQEIVDKHKPEAHTKLVAREKRVPLLVFKVEWAEDINRLLFEPLSPEVHYDRCECDAGKCKDCGTRPCDSQHNPLPHWRNESCGHCVPVGISHAYCTFCRDCIEDEGLHLHCGCGNLIKGDYPTCYCCSVGCKERKRDHRHCQSCEEKAPIYDRSVCRGCYQPKLVEERQLTSAREVNGRLVEQCSNCKYGCQYVCFLS